ncbi:hypothetical protein ACJRO7_008514 [Eucalyptus globulus]|uniref:Histidine-containing phosphotransfer protein n=1 Tax=Eucalyptus globulus TaxID=34317 RepID=A0ABD3IT86_EUCGL
MLSCRPKAKKDWIEFLVQSVESYLNGIMDGEYEQTKRVRNSNIPNFMMDLIDKLLTDGDNSMRELAYLLNAKRVNYVFLATAALRIAEGGSSLGGCRLVAEARALLNASNNKDKRSCKTSHERVMNEYYSFRDKLRTLHQDSSQYFPPLAFSSLLYTGSRSGGPRTRSRRRPSGP